MNEVDTKHEVIAKINGYTIVRSEARKYDRWERKFTGRTKVYYDVCDEDEDLLKSFKTLREAKRFAETR
jgi:hypothetical protein